MDTYMAIALELAKNIVAYIGLAAAFIVVVWLLLGGFRKR